MIKHIQVFPRVVLSTMMRTKETISSLNWALISMYSTPKEQLVTEHNIEFMKSMNCRHALNICVGDLTKDSYENIKKLSPELIKEGMRLFDETDAQKILDFVKFINNEPIGILVIHCDAGISRSASCGLFLCRYLGLDESAFRKSNRGMHPNNYIYGILAEVSGITKDYKKYWNQLIIKSDNVL